MAQYLFDYRDGSTPNVSDWSFRQGNGSHRIYAVAGLLALESGSAGTKVVAFNPIDGISDVEALVRFRLSRDAGKQGIVSLRYGGTTEANTTGYTLSGSIINNRGHLSIDEGGTGNFSWTPWNYLPNVTYWARFRVNGNTMQAKVWTDGQPEPANWTLNATNTARPTGSYSGLHTYMLGTVYYSFISFGTNGDSAPREIKRLGYKSSAVIAYPEVPPKKTPDTFWGGYGGVPGYGISYGGGIIPSTSPIKSTRYVTNAHLSNVASTRLYANAVIDQTYSTSWSADGFIDSVKSSRYISNATIETPRESRYKTSAFLESIRSAEYAASADIDLYHAIASTRYNASALIEASPQTLYRSSAFIAHTKNVKYLSNASITYGHLTDYIANGVIDNSNAPKNILYNADAYIDGDDPHQPLVDMSEFIVHSDYKVDQFVYQTTIACSANAWETKAAYASVPTPEDCLPIAEWDTDPNFTNPRPCMTVINVFNGLFVDCMSKAGRVMVYETNYTGTAQAVYVRVLLAIPPGSTSNYNNYTAGENFIVNSDDGLLKIHKEGVVSSNSTINHELGYIPYCRVWLQNTEWTFQAVPMNAYSGIRTSIDDTNLYIGNIPAGAKIIYRIYTSGRTI